MSLVPRFPLMGVVIVDSKHLSKRIRYRWVEEKFSVDAPGNGFFLSLARIPDAKCLSLVALINSDEGKMRDWAPLRICPDCQD
jgi:hypothetical protein